MTPSLRLLVDDRGRLRHDAQVRYQRAAVAWDRRRRTVLRVSLTCFAVAIGLAVLLLAGCHDEPDRLWCPHEQRWIEYAHIALPPGQRSAVIIPAGAYLGASSDGCLSGVHISLGKGPATAMDLVLGGRTAEFMTRSDTENRLSIFNDCGEESVVHIYRKGHE